MSRNHRYVRSALTSAAGVVAFAVAAVNAFAEPPANPGTTRTATLTLADLDLSQAADVQIARRRIHQMARKLCEQVRDSLGLSPHQDFDDCSARDRRGGTQGRAARRSGASNQAGNSSALAAHASRGSLAVAQRAAKPRPPSGSNSGLIERPARTQVNR
jgi:UrcA family protein